MKRYFYFLAILLTSFISVADDTNIQNQLKDEFGSCYASFKDNLASCTPYVCNYPDLSDAKAWKAQSIRGFVENKCYVVYYSYVGDQIIGSPDHCFYTKDQTTMLSDLYKTLFGANSIIIVTDTKNQIVQLNYSACKKNDPKPENPTQ